MRSLHRTLSSWFGRLLVLLLALRLDDQRTCLGFSAPPSSSPVQTSRQNFRGCHYGSTTWLFATTKAVQTTNEVADDLLQLLLQRYRGTVRSNDDVTIIANYIDRLTTARVTFDLATCFADDDLYVVMHQQGPAVPLWEKISRGRNTNLKGQQYKYNASCQKFDSLTNYAELWGPGTWSICVLCATVPLKMLLLPKSKRISQKCLLMLALCSSLGLFIKVEGTAKEKVAEPVKEEDPITASTSNTFWNNLFLPNLGRPSSKKVSSSSRQCPCDIIATVQGGGLYAGNNNNNNNKKKWLDLSFIQGTGIARILCMPILICAFCNHPPKTTVDGKMRD